MRMLVPELLASPEDLDPEMLIREARAHQRRRRLTVTAVCAAILSGFILVLGSTSAPRSGSLLARSLHLPSLGRDGRCPVSSGRMVDNPFFVGAELGSGRVRVLLGDNGDIVHGQVGPVARAASGWFGIQTLWYAMPSYDGPFVVRGARIGAKGQIEVQPGPIGTAPGSGPLVVPGGPTINTFDTNWRPGHVRDAVTGRLVRTLTGYGYRTVPGSTWIKSPGCYAWEVDGRGFSETIVMDAL